MYQEHLQFHVERFSNNKHPKFTDQQVMTMYIYCTTYEKRLTIRDMYDFTRTYMSDIFVNLPSYVAVCNRISRLAPAFIELYRLVSESNLNKHERSLFSLMDSMPIVTCSGKRNAKVARDVTNKGYCSTKSMYYYGVKLHVLAYYQKGTLPIPESIIISPASESDINVFRDNWCCGKDRAFVADKIYQDASNEGFIKDHHNSILLSPVKYTRGVLECEKQRNRASDDLFNRAVSGIRQSVESLFNWLIERVNIQRASKVRSTAGLIAFIFRKLAAIFLVCKLFKP